MIERSRRVLVDVKKQLRNLLLASVIGGIAIGAGCRAYMNSRAMVGTPIERKDVPAPYQSPEQEKKDEPKPYAPEAPHNPDNMPVKDKTSVAQYRSFKHPDEVKYALRHAERRGVEPELLMAIRMAEGNGLGVIDGGARYTNDKGYKGIDGKLAAYENDTEKQYAWCAAILGKRQNEYNSLPADKQTGFVEFVKSSYCPDGDSRDKNGLNANWEGNVNKFYNKFKSERGS